LKRLAAWGGAAALVVLCTRTLVYALNPSPLALHFEHQAGGPRFTLVVLVALAAGFGAAAAVLWGAALGVQERRLLERRRLADEPRLRLWPVLLRAVALFAVTALAFDLVESTIHWYEGLGWHGIHCLVGPVHRDAIPILAALSAIAAALGSAVEHVVRWMRRTIALLRSSAPLAPLSFPVVAPPLPAPRGSRSALPFGARAPPLPAG
jgi:hypothetical protein